MNKDTYLLNKWLNANPDMKQIYGINLYGYNDKLKKWNLVSLEVDGRLCVVFDDPSIPPFVAPTVVIPAREFIRAASRKYFATLYVGVFHNGIEYFTEEELESSLSANVLRKAVEDWVAGIRYF